MEVQIISKETIKPSCPTPPHLKIHKLSLLDQLSSRLYIARVLFYTFKDSADTAFRTAQSEHLKKSLSETLTKYYPFAGRLQSDGVYIDCNDEGVEFLEAQLSCPISVFFKQPKPETLHLLFPSGLLGNNSYKGSLLVIQINYFECGGLAISVCISHKIVDGCAMCNFISDWAVMARQGGEKVLPTFISAAFSSLLDDTFKKTEIELKKQSCITRRFVFDASQIAHLKAMAAESEATKTTTRVEAVTALLYKCAMAASRENSSSLKTSILIQTVNMRTKMVPPLPENSVGNFCWHFTVSLRGERDMNLQEFVSEMRKGMSEFYSKYGENFKLNEWLIVVGESMKEAKGLYDGKTDFNVFSSNSMCRFPFYLVDFGWGKPVWVAIAGNVFKNTFVLMDTPCGDGIEAWVTLDEHDMAVFESDEELLAFCSFNPSVVLDSNHA